MTLLSSLLEADLFTMHAFFLRHRCLQRNASFFLLRCTLQSDNFPCRCSLRFRLRFCHLSVAQTIETYWQKLNNFQLRDCMLREQENFTANNCLLLQHEVIFMFAGILYIYLSLLIRNRCLIYYCALWSI